MRFMNPLRLSHTLLLVLAFAVIAFAQADQGRIVGTVTDANGAIVPGATVVIKNDRTGDERTATTSESGYYVVSALKPQRSKQSSDPV